MKNRLKLLIMVEAGEVFKAFVNSSQAIDPLVHLNVPNPQGLKKLISPQFHPNPHPLPPHLQILVQEIDSPYLPSQKLVLNKTL
jgi:hypothetical protein